MSWLIVPVTVILLRGALSVLLLAEAETLFGDYLSARVRRALWIICIFLLMMPQFEFSFQPFTIDLSGYRDQVISVADILPRQIAGLIGDIPLAQRMRDYSQELTGLSYQNYPYLLGLALAILPALFLLLGSYLKCRRRTEHFKPVTDGRILKIWHKVCGNAKHIPQLLDSGEENHPPVLFGFFSQKLLFPANGLKHLTDEEVELLLMHEFIHYRSGDGIINILTLCFWPFCWYNPFFLAARRHLRINCELACDAEVLKRYPEKTAVYGKLLLSFANSARPPEVTMAFSEYAGKLRTRILYMTALPQRKKSSFTATFGLALLLAAPFGLFSAITREEDEFSNREVCIQPVQTEKENCIWHIRYPESFSGKLYLGNIELPATLRLISLSRQGNGYVLTCTDVQNRSTILRTFETAPDTEANAETIRLDGTSPVKLFSIQNKPFCIVLR